MARNPYWVPSSFLLPPWAGVPGPYIKAAFKASVASIEIIASITSIAFAAFIALDTFVAFEEALKPTRVWG